MNTILLMAGPQGQGNPMGTLIMFVLIGVVFYFFMIRPQLRKQKEAKSFRESLKKGDQIVTIGGIHGTIDDIKDTTVTIKAHGGQAVLKVEKSAIIKDFEAAQQK